jgi:NhaP-type Na+/H+ or K+/H+ antiporter
MSAEGGVEQALASFTILDRTITFMILGTWAGAMTDILFKKVFPRWLQMPSSLYYFILGIILAAWAKLSTPTVLYGNVFVSIATDFDPDVIFFVLLPIIIFDASSNVNWNVFKKASINGIWLGSVGVLLFIFITFGIFQRLLEGVPGWTVSASVLLAAILSATDPVPVLDALESVGAPPQLAGLIDGEALLNDGSAFVAVEIFLGVVIGEVTNAGQGVQIFFLLAVGGPSWGLLIGLLLFFAVKISRGNPYIESGFVLTSIWASYFIGELLFNVSGILSVTFLGFTIASTTKYHLSPEANSIREATLELLTYWAEMLIIILAGSIFAGIVFPDPLTGEPGLATEPTSWALLFVIFFVIQAARAIVVTVSYPLLSRNGYGLNVKEGIFLAYAGLRGVDTLALALVVEEEIRMLLSPEVPAEERLDPNLLNVANYINFFLAGAVMLSSAVNGYLAEYVYRALDIYPTNPAKKKLFESAVHQVEHGILHEKLEEVVHDNFYKDSIWSFVSHCIPDLGKVKYISGTVHSDEAETHVSNVILNMFAPVTEKRKHFGDDFSSKSGLVLSQMIAHSHEHTHDSHEEGAHAGHEHMDHHDVNTADSHSHDHDETHPVEKHNDHDHAEEPHDHDVGHSSGDTMKHNPAKVDKHDGHGVRQTISMRRATEKQRRVTNTSAILQNKFDLSTISASEKLDLIQEVSFNAVRASYAEQFEKGEISSAARTVLDNVAGVASDSPGLHVAWTNEFMRIEKKVSWKPSGLLSCLRLPLLSYLADSYIARRYLTSIEIALGYYRAHRTTLHLLHHIFPSQEFSEYEPLVNNSWKLVEDLKKRYPSIFAVGQTLFTARYVIHLKKEHLEELTSEGFFDESETESLIELLDQSLKQIELSTWNLRVASKVINSRNF